MGLLAGWRQHCYEVLLGVPAVVKVLGIALAMAVFLGGGMLWQIHQTWHGLLLKDLRRRGDALARELALECGDLAKAGRSAEISEELRGALQNTADVAAFTLCDQSGAVIAEAKATGITVEKGGLQEFNAALPGVGQELRVSMSTARIDYEVGWLTRRLARTTLVIALLGLLAAWFLTHLFTHPIQELVSLARSVKAGEYDVQATVRAKDEVGELAVVFNEMVAAIRREKADRQRLLRKLIENGEEERRRIARELHDQTGQCLTSQIAVLSALEQQSTDPKLRHGLEEVRALTEQTLSEVHDLAVALRPSMLDDLGLMAALRRHCQMFGQRLNLEISCSDGGVGDERLPAEIELTAYRLVQEALTNAVRHGRAERAYVAVQPFGNGLLVTVRDNGIGFDGENWRKVCVQGSHLGLLGLEERVSVLKGSFCVQSQPGHGTTVYAEIPTPKIPS